MIPETASLDKNSTPAAALTSVMACLEVGVSVSRNITPAFAYVLVLVNEFTLAIISASPVIGWFTN
ncbi:hypothetical protein D3C84_1130300 [compost metagenome]